MQEARAWCERQSTPFLLPRNAWLQLPLPTQVRAFSLPWSQTARALLTPDSQHLVACSGARSFLFHLPSRSLRHEVCESSGAISCIALSRSGRTFVTGCADAGIKVWDLEADSFRHRYSARHVPLTPFTP